MLTKNRTISSFGRSENPSKMKSPELSLFLSITFGLINLFSYVFYYPYRKGASYFIPTVRILFIFPPTLFKWTVLPADYSELQGKALSNDVCMHAKSLPSCLTLCDPMNCSRPRFLVHGILQARILEWVAMPSSRESFRRRNRTHISCDSCTAGRFFTAELPGKPLNKDVWL